MRIPTPGARGADLWLNTRRALTALVSASTLATALLLASAGQVAAATIVVDDDGVECPEPDFMRIDAAAAAAGPGDTITVCAGLYELENVVITDANITLLGAHAGDDFEDRTFGDASESTVEGTIRIAAEGATVDGFSMTNPGFNSVVTVDVLGNGALITNNIIHDVGSAALAVPATAVYLEQGPDGVAVTDNWISTIQSSGGSAQGILVGDSVSTNPSLDILIAGNLIEDLASTTRGAYGIQVNNGASLVETAIGYAEVEIRDNTIHDLTGNWAHAIGLEGDTPGAVVEDNVISNLLDVTATVVNDAVAVFFEANPSFATAAVNFNEFNLPSTQWGIALHPTLLATAGSNEVDGECNWWNSSTGPTHATNPGGTGARVTDNVDFEPWLLAPDGACIGGDEPEDRDDCKDGGWEERTRADGSTFRNQGDCMQYVNTGE